MWINAKKVEAAISMWSPLLLVVANRETGTEAADLVAFFDAITEPNVIEPTIKLMNDLSGAKPPAA